MAEDRKFKFEDGRFINRVSGEAIPDDEPVILFRARDNHAIPTILAIGDAGVQALINAEVNGLGSRWRAAA